MSLQKPRSNQPKKIKSDEPIVVKSANKKPTKALLASNKKGNRKAMGRPKGDAAIINEYKARMLSSPKSKRVLETIFDAALNDDHKHQSSAWKLIIDRIAPVGAFEQDVVKGGARSAIQINITGIGAPEVTEGDIIEGQVVEKD